MNKIKVNGQDVQIPENATVEFKDGILFINDEEYKKEVEYPVLEECYDISYTHTNGEDVYNSEEEDLFNTFKALYYLAKKWNDLCEDKWESLPTCSITRTSSGITISPNSLYPLKFKTAALAEKFLKDHKEQLELIKELL